MQLVAVERNYGRANLARLGIYSYSPVHRSALGAAQRRIPNPPSDLAHASLGLDSRRIRRRRRRGIALESAQNRRIGALQRRAAGVRVRGAGVLESSLALRGAGGEGGEDAALVLEHGGLDVGEDVALGEDLAAGGAVVEGVARVVLPQVVDGVQHGVAADLGRAAARVVDVVALQGDLVVGASGVQRPVVVAVAGRRVVRLPVEFVVGEGDAVGGCFAQDDHLAPDHGELAVVCREGVSTFASARRSKWLTNPDLVGSGNCDGVTTPDVLRVQVGDVDVLNDHVLCSVGDTETLATEDAFASNACIPLVISRRRYPRGQTYR